MTERLFHLTHFGWNLLSAFFLATCGVAGWLLWEGEGSAAIRFAFAFCGVVGLFADSKGGGFRYIRNNLMVFANRYQSWIFGLLIVGFLASILMPSFNAGNEKARASSSLSALQRYGIALSGYARDNNGFLPERLGSAKMYLQLVPYFDTKWNDPPSNIDPASGKPFLWRRSLGGLRIADLKTPEKVILAYSQPYKNLSHCRSVLFLDGHVKQYSVSAFWQVWREQPEMPWDTKPGKVKAQPVH
ncbi:MAG: hypothetical protein H8F28_26140 [Fibrella sp.]|nr:hypothetical protein [Armatimonadota bacterium]